MEAPTKRHLGVIAVVALTACAVALGHQDDSSMPRDVPDAQISPDGGSVLFTRVGHIWRIPHGGGDEQRLTTPEPLNAYNAYARWSPDTKQIAFVHRPSDRSGPFQILLTAVGTGAVRAITPASVGLPLAAVGPPHSLFEWSPTGRRIAFLARDGGLWVVDANGTGLRRLADGLSFGFAWAPDDSAIVRTTGDKSSGPLRAEIMAVEGGAPPQVIAHDVAPSVSWSRDGIIALIGRRAPGPSTPNRLFLARAPGFAIREMPIAADSNLAYAGSLGNGHISLTFMSPQGSWIERLTIATGERIFVVPPGTARIFLTPSWSLDGTRFAVVATDDSQPSRGDVYAGAVPWSDSGGPGVSASSVKRLTFHGQREEP